MSIFNDALPTQLVAVAPGRSVRWMGHLYVASQLISLPTADAEALAFAGYVVPPSAALVVALSTAAQALFGGITNVEQALLALLAQLAGTALQATVAERVSPSAAGDSIVLPYTVASTELLDLDLNGVRQWQGLDFTVEGNVLTFTGGGVQTTDVITFRKLSLT